MTCRHLWRPYADATRIWQVCDLCGAEEHVTTYEEQLASTLGYVMGSLHEPPSSSSTARSESGGGTIRQVEATPEILRDQVMARDRRIRALEAENRQLRAKVAEHEAHVARFRRAREDLS